METVNPECSDPSHLLKGKSDGREENIVYLPRREFAPDIDFDVKRFSTVFFMPICYQIMRGHYLIT
ncbi:MAG: hypothetical protein JXA41_14510 [Deltaproteobacteria bacterium]|nr:hypothetical protein [Deltaproteobacteria bacterium]